MRMPQTQAGKSFGTVAGASSLRKINYPGSQNYSQFTFDAPGQCTKISEYVGGSLSTVRQFIVNSEDKAEMRDGAGTVISQYFMKGQTISGANYYYADDHLGSVRELTDSSAGIQAQYSYSLYGQTSKLQGTLDSDFQYVIGYYSHSRSGLSMTQTRAYSASLGRWLNRDFIEEDGGINLYSYVANAPVANIDPSGLVPSKYRLPPASPYKNCYLGDKSCCGFNKNRCNETCPPCDAARDAAPAHHKAFYPTTARCRNCCNEFYNTCMNLGIQNAARSINSRAYQHGLVNDYCHRPGHIPGTEGGGSGSGSGSGSGGGSGGGGTGGGGSGSGGTNGSGEGSGTGSVDPLDLQIQRIIDGLAPLSR